MDSSPGKKAMALDRCDLSMCVDLVGCGSRGFRDQLLEDPGLQRTESVMRPPFFQSPALFE